MARYIQLEPHLSVDELSGRYRGAKEPVERSRGHSLSLLARGLTAAVIARITRYSACWIGRIARRYNGRGPGGARDWRHAKCAGRPDLPAPQLAELGAALAGPHLDGDRRCERTVARWRAGRRGRHVGRQPGRRNLRRIGARWLNPRAHHVRADPAARAEFKTHL